jgi:hypothetical protein
MTHVQRFPMRMFDSAWNRLLPCVHVWKKHVLHDFSPGKVFLETNKIKVPHLLNRSFQETFLTWTVATMKTLQHVEISNVADTLAISCDVADTLVILCNVADTSAILCDVPIIQRNTYLSPPPVLSHRQGTAPGHCQRARTLLLPIASLLSPPFYHHHLLIVVSPA